MRIHKRIFLMLAALLIISAPIAGYAQINVSTLNQLLGESGETAVLPIEMTDLAGENITSFEFSATYDTSKVEITGYDTTGTISAGLNTVDMNVEEDGSVYIAGFGSEALSGAGTFINLHVEFKNAGSTAISFSDFFLNNTEYTVNSCDIIVGAVDINIDDINGEVGGELMVPVEVKTDLSGKNVTAYEFTFKYDESVMNVTGYDTVATLSGGINVDFSDGDGEAYVGAYTDEPLTGMGDLIKLNVELVGSGIGKMSFEPFIFNEGTPEELADTAHAYVGLVDVFLPTAEITTGDTTLLPITLGDDVSEENITGYEFNFSYNTANLEILEDVVQENTLSSDWTVNSNPTAGDYYVGAYNDVALGAGDTLLLLKVVGLQESTSDLTFNELIFNEGTPENNLHDGEITVIDNRAPQFTAEMEDTVRIMENEELTFTYEANDPDGHPLTYTLSDSSMGMAIDSATGMFSWTPTFDQAGEHHLSVVVSDGSLTDTSMSVIVVSDVTLYPAMTLSAYEVDMGVADITDDPVKDTVTITNNGDVDLEISGIETSTDLMADFSGVVPVGMDTNLVVSWDPSVVGILDGMVTIMSNDTSDSVITVKGAAKDETYDNMNFEDGHPGWTELSGTWGYSGYVGHDGLAIYTYDEDAELMSPKMDLSGDNNFVSYYFYGPNLNDTGSIVIDLSTDGGDTWETIDSTGWDQTTWDWTHNIVELPTTDNESYIKFRMNQDSYQWHVNKIDDITLPGPPPYKELTIAQAKVDEDEDFVPDMLGEKVKLSGIVTTPHFDDGYTELYMQDSEAGICIFKYGEILDIDQGDEVSIIGNIDQYNGKTEIVPDTFEVLSTGNDLPEPLTMEDIAHPEEAECMLFKIEEARLTEDTWPDEGSDMNIDIFKIISGEPNDTMTMRIDQHTDLDGWDEHPEFDDEGVSEKFTIKGVIDQYDSSEPYDSGYQIKPRRRFDIYNIQSKIETDKALIPDEFALRHNYPNPFNPTTTIAFDTPKASDVTLRIYSINGRLVKEVEYDNLKPGYHNYHFNASNLSSGVYLYRIKADGFTDVKKMTLIK